MDEWVYVILFGYPGGCGEDVRCYIFEIVQECVKDGRRYCAQYRIVA